MLDSAVRKYVLKHRPLGLDFEKLIIWQHSILLKIVLLNIVVIVC